jgi:hypothetical protein
MNYNFLPFWFVTVLKTPLFFKFYIGAALSLEAGVAQAV